MKTHPRAKFHLISPSGYRETRVHGRTKNTSGHHENTPPGQISSHAQTYVRTDARTDAHTTTILISRQSLRRPAGIINTARVLVSGRASGRKNSAT
jgi:hypothetical protein